MMITQENLYVGIWALRVNADLLDIWKSSSGPSLSEIKYARK